MAGLFISAVAARAEEGFWLYNAPPLQQMRAAHGFAPSRAMLSHLLRSSARFDSGSGSGSFVSADGLFLTNWHLGKAFVRRMNATGDYLMKEGFYAPTPDKEIKLSDIQRGPIHVRAIEAIEDVTARVKAAGSDMSARNAVIATIEKSATGERRRGEVIRIAGGALYQLYRYRVYDDIRLVFMPEQMIGHFDGRDDDFQESIDRYDLYDFDVCIFRIYENGRPVHPKHFLRWSVEPVHDGELLFGGGDPGASWRNKAVSSFLFDRDLKQPFEVEMLQRLQLRYEDIAQSRPLSATAIKAELDRLWDGRRQWEYGLDDLRNPMRLAGPMANEAALRASGKADAAFARLDGAVAQMRLLYPRYYLLVDGLGGQSNLLSLALSLARIEAAPGAAESELRRKRVAAVATRFDGDVEQANLMAWLDMLVAHLGVDDPLVKAVLAGQSPRSRARAAAASPLLDPEARKAWLAAKGALKADDALLAIARAIDAEVGQVTESYGAQEAIAVAAQDELSSVRYALGGPDKNYPDATNTWRLTYGTVSGPMQAGHKVPAWSTFGQLFRYIDGIKRPDLLSSRWMEKKDGLNPDTPLGIAVTLDSVGGSSGTPIVNRWGAFVGVLNSSNVTLMTGSGTKDLHHDRAGIVAATAIIEGLRKVYGADALADELLKGRR